MSTAKAKVLFLVSQIPESSARNGSRRASFLIDRFDTLIITKNQPILPDSLSSANHINLAGVKRLFLLPYIGWLKYVKGYNVIHCQYAVNFILIGYISKKIFGYIWVWDVWDHPLLPIQNNPKLLSSKIKLFAYERFLKYLLASVDIVLVFMQRNILSELPEFSDESILIFGTNGYYVPEVEKTVTLGDGTANDVDSISIGRRLVIGYAGAIHENRGLSQIIRLSADENFEDRIEIKLWGQGTDAALSKLKKAAAENSNSLSYLGVLDHASSVNEIDQVDVCLCLLNLDVLNYQYAYPVKLFEYMHAGKVVISSRTHATGEVADNSEFVILIDSSYESLSDAIKEVLVYMHEGKLEALGENAQRAVEGYSWTAIERGLETDLYIALEKKLSLSSFD